MDYLWYKTIFELSHLLLTLGALIGPNQPMSSV
jgi:hypothetical protein